MTPDPALQVREIDELCDMKKRDDLTAEQFFGAVEIVLGRRQRNHTLSALIQGVVDGSKPVMDLTNYLAQIRQEDTQARSVPAHTYVIRHRTTAIEKTLFRVTLPRAVETYLSSEDEADEWTEPADVIRAAVKDDIEGAQVEVDWMEHQDDPAGDWEEFDEYAVVKP